MPKITAFFFTMLFGCASAQAQTSAQNPLPEQLIGDLGGALYASTGVVRGTSNHPALLPYAYFDYGRFFARTDTFGVKTVAIGSGYLELAGRVSREGYKSGVLDRPAPLPLGIGTFQETRYGGFFLYALHDFTSGGSLLEATYAGAVDVGGWTLYPQLGVERRSAGYVQHLYGVASYVPGASTVPVAGLAAELALAGPWKLVLQARRSWFDGAIRDSPLVASRTQDSGFVALAYAFK